MRIWFTQPSNLFVHDLSDLEFTRSWFHVRLSRIGDQAEKEKAMKYAHGSILLNGRAVSINDILSEGVNINSDFERETLAFIKIWLTDTRQFTLKPAALPELRKK